MAVLLAERRKLIQTNFEFWVGLYGADGRELSASWYRRKRLAPKVEFFAGGAQCVTAAGIWAGPIGGDVLEELSVPMLPVNLYLGDTLTIAMNE